MLLNNKLFILKLTQVRFNIRQLFFLILINSDGQLTTRQINRFRKTHDAMMISLLIINIDGRRNIYLYIYGYSIPINI